ncbi:MAG: transcriptional regulator [Veillonella sp.]|nr:transcriptional regulator [Veillonella sp.]
MSTISMKIKKVEEWKKKLTPETKLSRRAWMDVGYQHYGTKEQKDITDAVDKFLISATYTDNMSGTVDDLSISLEDRGNLWINDWYPSHGSFIDITMNSLNWNTLSDGQVALHVGKFQLDEIESSSPPNTVTLKAVALEGNSSLRETKVNKTWDKTSVKAIATDIAIRNNMTLYWDCDTDPSIDHSEQSSESDLAYLQKVCKDVGFAVKASVDQLFVLDVYKYDNQKEQIIIRRPGGQYKALTEEEAKTMLVVPSLISYKLNSKTRNIYRACHVRHKQGKSKELIEATFEAPDLKDKTYLSVLEVDEQCETQAEAERLARKKLREANSEAMTASFSMPGNIMLMAGEVVRLEGFGAFDGNYLLTKATHTLSSSYTTSIDLRRCLIGY